MVIISKYSSSSSDNSFSLPSFNSARTAFASDGSYLAVVERSDARDWICMIDCTTWTLGTRFPLDTSDASCVCWASDNSALAVWDSPIYPASVYFYSPGGSLLFRYNPYTVQKKPGVPGVRQVVWSPVKDHPIVAVAGGDGFLYYINSRTWTLISCSCMTSAPRTPLPNVVVFDEVEDRDAPGRTELRASLKAQLRYKETNLASISWTDPSHTSSQTFPSSAANDASKAPAGVDMCMWSPDGRFIAAHTDTVPNVLWIWEPLQNALSFIIRNRFPITSIRWHPTKSLIAVGSPKVAPASAALPLASVDSPTIIGGTLGIWTPSQAHCADMPILKKVSTDPQASGMVAVVPRNLQWEFQPREDSKLILLVSDQTSSSTVCTLPGTWME